MKERKTHNGLPSAAFEDEDTEGRGGDADATQPVEKTGRSRKAGS